MEFGKMRQIQSKGSVVVMAIPYDHPYMQYSFCVISHSEIDPKILSIVLFPHAGRVAPEKSINHTRWCPRSWLSLFITSISGFMLDISMINEGYKLINQQTSPGGTTLQCLMKLHVAQSVATCPKLGGASNCIKLE